MTVTSCSHGLFAVGRRFSYVIAHAHAVCQRYGSVGIQGRGDYDERLIPRPMKGIFVAMIVMN